MLLYTISRLFSLNAGRFRIHFGPNDSTKYSQARMMPVTISGFWTSGQSVVRGSAIMPFCPWFFNELLYLIKAFIVKCDGLAKAQLPVYSTKKV